MMAFVSVTTNHSHDEIDNMIDIIGIPAIGADPKATWNIRGSHQWLGPALHEEIPSARVLLYDHLEEGERSVEVKPLGHVDHEASTVRTANARDKVARFGLEDWTTRFIEAVHEVRNTESLQRRPLFLICHSTGGIVVKQALTRKRSEDQLPLASVCLGITFFATPHHGSKVIRDPACAHGLKNCLNMKWDMSEHLMEQFSYQNTVLERLNHRFSAVSIGIKIWNYVETQETLLELLTAGDAAGETLRKVALQVVDRESSIMTTADLLIEEESVIPLNTPHLKTAWFAGDNSLFEQYVRELKALLESTSAEEHAAVQGLNSSIMTEVLVDVHQFYQQKMSDGMTRMGSSSFKPTLQNFLEFGPTACLNKSSLLDEEENSVDDLLKPSVLVRYATEPIVPTTTVAASLSTKLAIPSIEIQQSTPHTVPFIAFGDPAASTTLGNRIPETATNPISLQTRHTRGLLDVNLSKTLDAEGDKDILVSDGTVPKKKNPITFREPKLYRSHTYQLPTKSQDRFRWVHVPYTHSGWVYKTLATIAQDKGNLALHHKVLSEPIWMAHHNRSKHASAHARFVRATSNCLFPEGPHAPGSYGHNFDEALSPSSAIDQVQLAFYMPYLFWDTFQGQVARSAVIGKRLAQEHARPVDPGVISGNSLEHKLIWQYMDSKHPIHCRRTLDQYGYPSLRNTAVRDSDQILYKQTCNKPEEIGVQKETHMQHIASLLRSAKSTGRTVGVDKTVPDFAAKVLMVDQLWLWILDNETVVTFAAPKEMDDGDFEKLYKQGDLIDSIYEDVTGVNAKQCNDCFDFAALVVYHASKALFDHTDDPNLQVFRIFEQYISELTEQQTESYRDFRDSDSDRDPGDIDNREDLTSLLELRDIEDELGVVDKLLIEQQGGVKEMLIQYKDINRRYHKGMHGTYLLQGVASTIRSYRSHVAAMIKSANSAREAYEKLLDMKQKQANIFEVHLAREQSERAAEQSRAVMIFTIFTIIFLPLSFFASVFGINAREWSGVPTNPGLHEIFVDMGSISVAVIVIALLVAFNRASRKGVQKIWKTIGKPVTSIFSRRNVQTIVKNESDAEKGFLGPERGANIRRSESKVRRSMAETKARRSISAAWRDDSTLGKYDVSISTG